MRLLTAGASGFVGRRLIAEIGRKHELYALTRRAPPDEIAGLATWIEQDLREPLAGLPARIDGVVHLAQSPRYKDFPDGAEDVYAINVHSTFRLLEWARDAGAQTFVLVSTGGLYAFSPDPVDETSAISPGGFYFRSKLAAEHILGAYAELLRPVILRPFFVYGEGQQRMLIARLAEQIVRGEEIVVDGDPGLRINPLHVDDMVRVFEPALTGSLSGVVNVAGPDAVSVSALVALLGEAIGIEPVVRHTPASVDGDLVAATDRMRLELGVTPQVGLAEGVRRVAESVALHR
jgi:nucleoside-diphosphate-sugar epimerase